MPEENKKEYFYILTVGWVERLNSYQEKIIQSNFEGVFTASASATKEYLYKKVCEYAEKKDPDLDLKGKNCVTLFYHLSEN